MPRRKRAAWGNVTKISPDAYRLRWVEDTPEGRRRLSETVRGTRREACARLDQIHAAVMAGARAASPSRRGYGGSPTVGAVWEHSYLPLLDALVAAGNVKPGTRSTYRAVWAKHGGRWRDVPVSEVYAADVQEWVLAIGNSTASTARCVLANVLDRAVQLGHIATNPAKGRFVTGGRVDSRPRGVYTLAQLGEVWEALRGSAMEAAWLLMAHGGLRVGESCAVRPEDLRRASMGGASALSVDVRATVRTDRTLGPTKNGRPRTAVVLEPWASRLEELAGACEGGRALSHDAFMRPFTTVLLGAEWRSVDLPPGVERLPLRNLRNSYETYMRWERGVPVEVTAKLLGHASTATTEAHYDRPGDAELVQRLLSC